MKMRVCDIRVDDALQSREAMDPAVVAEYAEAMTAGAVFPPVMVFQTMAEAVQDVPDSLGAWLADGFHRHAAAVKAGLEEIEVDLRAGGRREALLHSLGANATHGLKRTNADKRKAVLTLLQDPEWAIWSDREIARQVSVGNRFVGDIRREMTSGVSGHTCGTSGDKIITCPDVQQRKGADGKVYTVPAKVSVSEGKLRGLALEGAIRQTVEALMRQVPDDKKHFVAKRLESVAWEMDPEGQPAQERYILEENRKARGKTR